MLVTLNMSGDSTVMAALNSSLLIKCSFSSFLAPFWTYTAFAVANVFFQVPLLVFVLFLGCRRWRERSCSASSHSDVFTYNMAAMEMAQVLASICFIANILIGDEWMNEFSQYVIFIMLSVKPEFQMLTCVELYLAVVFPISYLRHKASAGAAIRNFSIACVWLNCAACAVLTVTTINDKDALILYFFHMLFLLFVICFCCVSVLWTLKRQGPARGRDREQADQSKLRAFYTILLIMAVLLLSLGGVAVCKAIKSSVVNDGNADCFSAQCAELMSLPSSFVLPLLFLHRAGKLPSCKKQSNK